MTSVAVFLPMTLTNGDLLSTISHLAKQGFQIVDCNYRDVCPTTAKILELHNRKQRDWALPNTKVFVVMYRISPVDLASAVRSYWQTIDEKRTQYPDWYMPYVIPDTDKKTELFASALSVGPQSQP